MSSNNSTKFAAHLSKHNLPTTNRDHDVNDRIGAENRTATTANRSVLLEVQPSFSLQASTTNLSMR